MSPKICKTRSKETNVGWGNHSNRAGAFLPGWVESGSVSLVSVLVSVGFSIGRGLLHTAASTRELKAL